MPISFNITWVIITINVGVFLYSQSNPNILYRMTFVINRIRKNREYDRFFLAGFAHAGFMHLIFNMLTLYFFGPFLESAIGSTAFLLLFLASIIGGNLYCMVMKKEDQGYAALGASGGVLGVIYGTILVAPNIGLSLFMLPISIPGWLFGILFTVISIVLTQLKRGAETRISHEGHLGGALTGALIVLVIIWTTGLGTEQIYFLLGGVIPLILFVIIKWLAPSFLYRHRDKF
jgi:membrane associated rhomboid family serine protease